MKPGSLPSGQLVEKNKPELAKISKMTFEEYSGEVGRASEVACFAHLFN